MSKSIAGSARGSKRKWSACSDTTRVMLQIDYEPEGMVENVGDVLGLVKRRMERDLERFKEFVEGRQGETGAWRGEIHPRELSGGQREVA